VVFCLEQGADLYMAQLMPLPPTVSCSSKIQIGFTFLVPAHLGSHGQRAVKWVCVCVCVYVASSEELKVLTQSLLSLDWLNHTKYGPLCCLVPHVGASICLQLCPLLPQFVLTAFAQHSLTAPVCLSVCIYLFIYFDIIHSTAVYKIER